MYHIDLQALNHACIPELNTLDHVVWFFWCIVTLGLLISCWGFLYLHLCPLVILACNFLSCDIFVWFWYQGDASLIEWALNLPSSAYFWNSLRRIIVFRRSCRSLIFGVFYAGIRNNERRYGFKPSPGIYSTSIYLCPKGTSSTLSWVVAVMGTFSALVFILFQIYGLLMLGNYVKCLRIGSTESIKELQI